jgi:hypothetical protein
LTEPQAAKIVELLKAIADNTWFLRELAEKIAKRFGL